MPFNINPPPPGHVVLDDVVNNANGIGLLGGYANVVSTKAGTKKPKVFFTPLVLNRAAKPFNAIEDIVGEDVFPLFTMSCFVGSKVICNPVPENADTDILARIRTTDVYDLLEQRGWKFCDGYGVLGQGAFAVFKKGKVDLITTRYNDYYNYFIQAVKICKMLNIVDKKQRIAVHEILLKPQHQKAEW